MSRGLGRVYVPDNRDWKFADLRDHLAKQGQPPAVLDQTLRQVAAEGLSWARWRQLWALIKQWLLHPSPVPQPGPPSPGAAPWADPVVLDQGQFGTCVGNGWAGWGDAAPTEDSYTEADAVHIYLEATTIDTGKPDETLDTGTSVRSGAKAMKARGKLTAYAFESDVQAIIDWLNTNGPVVLGTDWLEGMDQPDAVGVVSVTGNVRGGHCYLCLGYDPKQELFKCRNSWGTGWGVNGDFWIGKDGLALLMANNGEACAAVEIA